MIPIARACAAGGHKRVFAVTAAQSSKSQTAFNVIGHRLDDDPVPVLYIGPTKTNIVKVIEPKVDAMLRDCPSLWAKTVKGQKYTTTKKLIGGTSLRFAWAGSTTEIKSDSAGIVVVDEIDEIEVERRGQGSIIPLADARHKSFSDGKTIGFSTPTEGDIETYTHPVTKIEHWAYSQNVSSAIWILWQGGTRCEYAWPCPECGEYFVPRFKLLWWPEKSTPTVAMKSARLTCPRCGALIDESHKENMNARGEFLSPGQSVNSKGDVVGDGIESTDATFWVSGLANPFIPWGEVAANWLRATRSGDQEAVKGVLNTDLGECFRIGGVAPKFAEVRRCAIDYAEGEVPTGVQLLTVGVDVQSDRLVYAVRGWGARYQSWLIEKGELWGDPREGEVWGELDELLGRTWSDLPIVLMAIDAGYLSNEVYDFARNRRRQVRATKGRLTLDKPFYATNVDVSIHGRVIRNGVKLWHFSTDVMKSWVHSRIRPAEQSDGNQDPADHARDWHLPIDISEDYCKQIIAEERVVKPSGAVVWIRTARENHFLDCEALNYLAVRMLGPGKLKAETKDDKRNPRLPRGSTRTAEQPESRGSRVVPKRRTVVSDDPYV